MLACRMGGDAIWVMLVALETELLTDGLYGMYRASAQSSTQPPSACTALHGRCRTAIDSHVRPISTHQRSAVSFLLCSYFEKNPTAGYCRAVVSGKVRKAQEKFPTLMIR